jgi:pyruvate,water dikinase
MNAPMFITQDRAIEVGRVGGKAAALARLVKLGFDVPPFFVVEPSLADHLDRLGLDEALSRLGAGPYAVRSSGREEDGAAHSHAGQFLSLLDVAAESVSDAIGRVVASGRSEGLRGYRAAQGLDPDGGAPAVIVQRLVAARAAGVAFSADPVSGRRDRIVISATAGLGDKLVGGEVDGCDYLADAVSGKILSAPDESPLSETDASRIATLVREVATAMGSAQDVEWALEGDQLWLLQARPITTPLRPLPIPDRQTTIFDNSNIVESYPGMVSPLTYSFAQYAYARVYRAFLGICGVERETIRQNASALENMLGRIDGRVYYNLVNWYRLLALLPGFRLNRAYMETMMGVGEPLPADIADALAPPPAEGLSAMAEWARVVRMVAALGFEAFRIDGTIERFYARLNEAMAGGAARIDRMSPSELAATYRRIEADLLVRWDAPLINDFLCMIAFGASRKLSERWAGAAGLLLHNDVMIGQGDIVSAEPPQRIARMGRIASGDEALMAALAAGDRSVLGQHPELAAEVASYIDKFGDRCTEELKLESIPLDLDPTPLLASVAAAARHGGETVARQRGGGLKGLDDLLAGRPVRKAILKVLLGWAKARVRDRENLRLERTRIFGLARRVFLAIGTQMYALGKLDDARDVFFLTVPEVLGAIEGFALDRDLASLVALRKQQFEADAKLPDPPERIAMRGAMAGYDARKAPLAERPTTIDLVLQGTGCSAGKVVARARVVHDPSSERIVAGEVLVARHTDPGWIALFTNASAIVVERGSLLSHSAIVARELGIPCVVGLKGAMTRIVTGEMIEVDGASGQVRKLQ